jgi:hypothetical protein
VIDCFHRIELLESMNQGTEMMEEAEAMMVRRRVQALLEAMCAARMAREDRVPCLIEAGLFLGSVGAALNKQQLQALGITHVLTVARSLQPAFPADFTYKKIDGSLPLFPFLSFPFFLKS